MAQINTLESYNECNVSMISVDKMYKHNITFWTIHSIKNQDWYLGKDSIKKILTVMFIDNFRNLPSAMSAEGKNKKRRGITGDYFCHWGVWIAIKIILINAVGEQKKKKIYKKGWKRQQEKLLIISQPVPFHADIVLHD